MSREDFAEASTRIQDAIRAAKRDRRRASASDRLDVTVRLTRLRQWRHALFSGEATPAMVLAKLDRE